MIAALGNHLWQSTLFCAMVALSMLFLQRNRAAVRHRLWLAASMKFLVPFSLFVSITGHIEWRKAPVPAPPQRPVLEQINEPFASPVWPPEQVSEPPAPVRLPAIFFAVWFGGFLIQVVAWRRRWGCMRAALRVASPIDLGLPIRAVSTPSRLEPGVFGVFRPVLLLPEGIAEHLTAAQFQLVVAHELCHVRRRDNLAAAAHMVVEALFWFHPLVWWIRVRLVEERERACDEAVLSAASDARDYAESIVAVCRYYLKSPLVCASGVTGSNLKRRVEAIMSNRGAIRLNFAKRIALAMAGAAALAAPIAIGVIHAPYVRAQSSPAPLSFEVASVKPNQSGSDRSPSMILPGGRFTATNNTLRALILNAYGISPTPYLLEGGPGWIDSTRYDIEAKAGAGVIPAGTSNRVLVEKTRLMLQSLLADRFRLSIRRQTREMGTFELVVARSGPKLQKTSADCDASAYACHGFSGNPRRYSGIGVDMYDLAFLLSSYSDRPVIDRTGVEGLFDMMLHWNVWAGRTPPAPTDDGPPNPAVAAREGYGSMPESASLPALPQALQEQLGLTLESHKRPVDVYVIDRVERPSEN